MKGKVAAMVALVFSMALPLESIAGEEKNRIHTLCKQEIKQNYSDSLARIRLNGFSKQNRKPIAKYRVAIEGGRTLFLRCGIDQDSGSIMVWDRDAQFRLAELNKVLQKKVNEELATITQWALYLDNG
ncbi:MAG: hypothetical protein CMA64_10795 [Euryarchaeota archaeon]|nr:hypothetical protein [Euryarchaeota archaeon]|tara:strand:- start:540 stop:923 length:384 start_codon:yes stop_codon:yes gene_type:complete